MEEKYSSAVGKRVEMETWAKGGVTGAELQGFY